MTCESGYYHHWTTIPRRPVEQAASETDPHEKEWTLTARPIYLHAISEDKWRNVPTIGTTEQTYLKSAQSEALLPNVYLFCGQIIGVERYKLPEVTWTTEIRKRIRFIVDCGLPLHFGFNVLDDETSLVPSLRLPDVEEGKFITGLIRLVHFSNSGLSQPVRGVVRGARVLGLNPNEEDLGKVRDVPFNTRLQLDPDTISQEFAFLKLEITGKSEMRTIPYP